MTLTMTPPREYDIADLFCGAGGSSTGAQKAIQEEGGIMNLIAINHWNKAIATHSANHPRAKHIVEDVSMVDPRGSGGERPPGSPHGLPGVQVPLKGQRGKANPRPRQDEPVGRP